MHKFSVSTNHYTIIVDKRLTFNMRNTLINNKINIIDSTKCNELYNAISFHPDISICKLDNDNIVIAPNVYDYYYNKLKNYDINIIKGHSFLEFKYPNNIQYNVAILGKFAIHNFNFTDDKILNFLEKNNYTKIHVKQGYSKCSTCIVDDNSIITSDKSIHLECLKYNIDSLFIEPGHIELFDMNYGFIGGCSGFLNDSTIAFTGNISSHPNYNEIYNFISSKNKSIIELSDEPLLDLGSIILLK